MNIVYETNGKGFLGWIVDLPGAYVRGSTIDEARNKIESEIKEYEEWLNISASRSNIYKEAIVHSNLMIEDADSDIILENELEDYESYEAFLYHCNLSLISAKKVETIYQECKSKDIVDPAKARKTFYGNAHATIRTQYKHIVDVQQYYLWQIGTSANIDLNIVDGRINTIRALQEKYIKEGNKLYENEEEDWTLRKVIRRLIWHDRIHAKAIERMNKRIIINLTTALT